MVSSQGLTKSYRGAKGTRTLAADGISFSCAAGEVFGLLGPNGAGKTTTLRMLSTVLTPTKGTAVIAGHDVVGDPGAVRSSIGFLSGNTGLYPRLTPREVLEYFGLMYRMPRPLIAERTARLSALLGMDEFLDKRCDALSSGMKQKVNIARTVLHDPPVLILDEPTVGLDVLTSRTIVEFVNDCRTQGKCVIFSTHIMAEVAQLCDRLAIIHKGRVQFGGTLDEFRAHAGQDLEQAFVDVLEAAV
ncbi:MAG: ABC transporter ATP-binding protein [Planctomycetota bacterium]